MKRLPDNDRLNNVLAVLPRWGMRSSLGLCLVSGAALIAWAIYVAKVQPAPPPLWPPAAGIIGLLISMVGVLTLERHQLKPYCRYRFQIAAPTKQDIRGIMGESRQSEKLFRIDHDREGGVIVGAVEIEWFAYLKMKYQH